MLTFLARCDKWIGSTARFNLSDGDERMRKCRDKLSLACVTFAFTFTYWQSWRLNSCAHRGNLVSLAGMAGKMSSHQGADLDVHQKADTCKLFGLHEEN